MKIKNEFSLKKFFCIVLSLLVLNSFVLNDLFAFTQPMIPTINTLNEKNININLTNARITDFYINKDNKYNNFIVFIQDLHDNVSVQKKISVIIHAQSVIYREKYLIQNFFVLSNF